MTKIFSSKKTNLIIVAFFILYLAFGIAIHDDYGISWDEPVQRPKMLTNVKYIAEKVPGLNFLNNYIDSSSSLPDLQTWNSSRKYYGPAFGVPLAFLEILLDYDGSSIQAVKNGTFKVSNLWHLRHLFTFCFFFIGVVFFYLLTKERFESRGLGLLGAIFLVLSPRIFAHSFYNPKDIPLLSAFIIALYFCNKYLAQRTHLMAILAGFATGYAVDVRVAAIIILPITMVFFMFGSFKNDELFETKSLLKLLTYFGFTAFFIILFRPLLWDHTVSNMIKTFNTMSNYGWGGSVWYFGNSIKGSNVPWHYIPTWITFTTPVTFSIMFVVGLVFVSISLWKNKFELYINDKQRQDLFFLSLFLGPLLAVITFDSTLYDAWRQMFFVYVPFLLLALAGLVKLFSLIVRIKPPGFSRVVVFILALLIILNVAMVAQWMIINHPHQNVYFSLAAKNPFYDLRGGFEWDYWMLSFKDALGYINDKQDDTSDSIEISDYLGNVRRNSYNFSNDFIRRLEFVKFPKYCIAGYRNGYYHGCSLKSQNRKLVYEVRVDGLTLTKVFLNNKY